MGLFDQFPYTNFHELNLDWLIRLIKELENTVNNFVALNTIKYADPIQWNITTQYEANTVVVDPQTGTAYISSKAVPAGVALTNTEYWSVIFTLDIISANKNLTLRDDGSNVLATFASAAGDWLLWNGTLYKVSQTINVNEAYVDGYNLTRYTVESFIEDLKTLLTSEIGDLNNLTTSDTSSIVNAINSLVPIISKRQNYISPKMLGAAGDGVTDDTVAIQAAIDYAITNRVEVNFDTATYLVTAPIEITAPVFINGNNAIISAGASMSSVFEINIPNPLPSYGRGVLKSFLIKANYQATSAIELISNINAIVMEDIQINDPINYGIYGNSGTVCINNCMIRNTDSSHLNVVGIRCNGSDNEIIEYMAVNCVKSLIINGLSRIERNVSWNSYPDLMKVSLYAEVNANCEFIDCMIDTWATGIDGSGFMIRLTNCTFFWSPQYYTDATVGDSITRPYLFGDNLQGAILNGVRVFRASGRSVTTSLFTPTQKTNYLYNVAFKNVLDGVLNIPTIGSSNVTHSLNNVTATTDSMTVVNTPTGKRVHVNIVGTLSAAVTDRAPVITAIGIDYRPNSEILGKAFVGLYNGDLIPVLWDANNNRFVLITPSSTTYAAGTNIWIDFEYNI